jgi:hypothetical protein
MRRIPYANRLAPIAGAGWLAMAAGCGGDGAPSRPAAQSAPPDPVACGSAPAHEPRGCVPADDLLRRPPYLGVSCPVPNSIACDRVGIDLELRRPAETVHATIAGRRVVLQSRRAGPGLRTHWQGFLQPAGLLDGALRVTPDRGRHHWIGTRPVTASIHISVRRSDGTTEVARLRQRLAAGWG